MSALHRLLSLSKMAFLAAFLLAGLTLSGQAFAETDTVFTVQGVNVDVTADSAADAREQAFAEAQYEAFKKLAARLLSEEEMTNFEMPEVSVISSMVKDFEITQEKLSNVRYLGTYTFTFKDKAVRGFLGSRNLAYTDVGSKPVLVLPFYQWGARNILWSENNAWLKAWSSTRSFSGLVPIIVPIGDLQDVSDIADDEALTYAADKLDNMVSRYGAGEAIIMLAMPAWNGQEGNVGNSYMPDKLTLMIYRTDLGVPELATRMEITQADMQDGEDLFAAAVRISRASLQKAWKSQTMTTSTQANVIKVRVKFDQMQEWIETQKVLRRVSGVNEVKLLSLKQNEAHVELQFQGTIDRLKLALAQADMTLSPAASQQPVAGNPYQQQNQQQNQYAGYYNWQQPQAPQSYDLYLNKYYNQQGQYR